MFGRFTDYNLYYYDFAPFENYVQDPLFTAKHREGDCEDQAILVYAMIKYYQIYIYGKEYAT